MASFRRVALIGKPNSRDVDASLKEIREFLASRGCEVQREGKGADLAVVAGGDGTMLAAARDLVPLGVPLVGINQGRLGFMTDIGHDDMRSGLGAILDGRYVIEERSLLDAEILRSGKSMLRTVALNEAVVGKGAQGRLIEFELSLDGEFVYTLRADGILVATPTGSTAYALSAQGPILHPAVPALALVPLNPHTLSARPVSVSDKSVIEIKLARTPGLDAQTYFDGFALAELAPGDRLVLKRSAHAARFVHPPGYRYFATLREKLGWSETLRKDRPT
jgi:NAD+ kinase